jgi:hypothetical protein
LEGVWEGVKKVKGRTVENQMVGDLVVCKGDDMRAERKG